MPDPNTELARQIRETSEMDCRDRGGAQRLHRIMNESKEARAAFPALVDELNRLREIVERPTQKPKAMPFIDDSELHATTADGVTLTHGLEVWFHRGIGKNRFKSEVLMARVDKCCGDWWTFQVDDESTRWCRNPELVFSTHEAALAAGGKGTTAHE